MSCLRKLISSVCLGFISLGATASDRFDISPFALPNVPANELWFEEARDIVVVDAEFETAAPKSVKVYYRRHYWPEKRIESLAEQGPMRLGWAPQDDLFNGEWHEATVSISPDGDRRVRITFKPLTAEFPDLKDYDVTFRRTTAVRVESGGDAGIARLHAYTVSSKTHSQLRVEFDEKSPADASEIRMSGHNARVTRLHNIEGTHCTDGVVALKSGTRRAFSVDVEHMKPAHAYCEDDGLVTFDFGTDAFTISLSSLKVEGPIWSPDFGAFVAWLDDSTTLADYQTKYRDSKTLNQRVLEQPEQSYAGAYRGQPRPHAVPYYVGCALARQRFRIEPDGLIAIKKRNVEWVPGDDTSRYLASGDLYLSFGFDEWMLESRSVDPEPANVFNLRIRTGALVAEEKVFAVPLQGFETEWLSDDMMVAMVRIRLRNDGPVPIQAVLPIRLWQEGAERANDPLSLSSHENNTYIVKGPNGRDNDELVLRFVLQTSMSAEAVTEGLRLSQELQPGKSCDVLLRVPHVALAAQKQMQALTSIDFASSLQNAGKHWRDVAKPAATLRTPVPQLNALYASHLTHTLVTDFTMPGDYDLINTSVGSAVYGNFTNESAMIVHELDERGMFDQARRRLDLWVKYQGTAPQPGNFTDFDGMYFGAAGFEQGAYNQHHAWALWAICEHFWISGEEEWFRSVADSVIKGADWVFRQRKNTNTEMPHSRGWERGFLPAGSLEDVEDYYYWLATNAVMWRSVNVAAKALADIQHPEAARVQSEADAYRSDLIAGFETSRKTAPLVKLRNGNWIPNYPSRLYRRGRELGWIRDTLEGSVYLLLSGLYDPHGREAQWILDDFQDNRYPSPPYGYHIPDFEDQWFNRAGISMQPFLLAGLLPHIDRDEPEIYIWMFYNAWLACYREEVNAMVEHPSPYLGFSNHVVFKTSDEANAVSWLRYMFVYTDDTLLHFGRAIPRGWFGQSEPFETQGVATRFGKVGVRYSVSGDRKKISAEVELDLRRAPGKILVRMRHPGKAPIRSVTVNGEPQKMFGPVKGDVDITGMNGKIVVEAAY
jgi:hypothetical protein